MKNKIKKYATIGTIAIMGLLLANTAVEKTVTVISDTDTSCVTVYSGGEKTVGREDGSYRTMEKYATDEEIYACIEDAYFSTPVIEQILNDGRCLAYVDQLKAEGWIPQDFTPAGSKSSNTSSVEAKPETPAETSNETSASDNKQPEKTEKTISLKQRQRQRKSQRRKKLMQHGKKQREWKQPAQRMVRSFIPIPLQETQKKNLFLQPVMITK